MLTISKWIPHTSAEMSPREARDAGPAAFTLGHGSIAGREHLRISRNNQDAVALSRGERWLVAVVTDGCSAGAHSEVGARLGATWLANTIPHTLDAAGEQADPADPSLVAQWTSGLTAYLAAAHGCLRPTAQSEHVAALTQLQELFLFGFLVAIVGTQRSAIVGLGDGLYAVNGVTRVLDPGPENAPAYLAYRLAKGSLERPIDTEPQVHFAGATADIDTLVIATDGAAELLGTDLRHFEQHPRYQQNPSLLQKQLRLLAGQRRLADDTSLVLLRRPALPGCPSATGAMR